MARTSELSSLALTNAFALATTSAFCKRGADVAGGRAVVDLDDDVGLARSGVVVVAADVEHLGHAVVGAPGDEDHHETDHRPDHQLAPRPAPAAPAGGTAVRFVLGVRVAEQVKVVSHGRFPSGPRRCAPPAARPTARPSRPAGSPRRRPGRPPHAACGPCTPRSESMRLAVTVVSRSSASRTGTGAIRPASCSAYADRAARPPGPAGWPASSAGPRSPRPPRARRRGRRAGRDRCPSRSSRDRVTSGEASTGPGSLSATPTRTDPTSTPSRRPRPGSSASGPIRAACRG